MRSNINISHSGKPFSTQAKIPINSFMPISIEDMEKFIKRSPSKSCELDPIPTNLLKEVLDKTAPLITDILNASLTQGTFPQELKEALLHPLLKKNNLDLIKKNYHPVSNLAYIGRWIECIASAQIIMQVDTTDIMK